MSVNVSQAETRGVTFEDGPERQDKSCDPNFGSDNALGKMVQICLAVNTCSLFLCNSLSHATFSSFSSFRCYILYDDISCSSKGRIYRIDACASEDFPEIGGTKSTIGGRQQPISSAKFPGPCSPSIALNFSRSLEMPSSIAKIFSFSWSMIKIEEERRDSGSRLSCAVDHMAEPDTGAEGVSWLTRYTY